VIDYKLQADILSQALPYIRKLKSKTIVVKYGGNAMLNDELKSAVMSDIVLLNLVGINVILVHGGGPEITAMLDALGKKSEFASGQRVTDAETIDVVQMVLCGKVNKSLCGLISSAGGKAIGLCGLDSKLLYAKKKLADDGADIGFVGEIKSVNPEPISDMLKDGYIPVVASVAGGKNDTVYNVNADAAASAVAAELHAEKLILMTDIRGLMRDVDDEGSLISKLNVSDVPKLKNDGIISGGMIPKIDCCVEAVRRGVNGAHIIDGRIKHSILIEMLSDAGIGTMIS
jgi:acetylglutamate kinase